MLLRTEGPSAIFAEYPVVLHVPESDADKVRVFHAVRECLCLPLPQQPWGPQSQPAPQVLFIGALLFVVITHLPPKLFCCCTGWGYTGKTKGEKAPKRLFPMRAGILTFPWRGKPHVAPGTVLARAGSQAAKQPIPLGSALRL